MIEILILLLLLQLKHYIADFAIQTYQQTIRKGIYKDPVGISHSMDHICLTLIILLIFNAFHTLNPLMIFLLAVTEGIIHYHIDYVKVRYGSKDVTTHCFWNQFGLDQFAHQVTYLGMAYLLLI